MHACVYVYFSGIPVIEKYSLTQAVAVVVGWSFVIGFSIIDREKKMNNKMNRI